MFNVERNIKIVLSGASQGIGKAIALDLASLGASIGLVARNEAALMEVAEQINECGGVARPFAADLTNPEAARKAVNYFLTELKNVDVLINAVGIQAPIGPFVENDLELWEHNLRVNLLGPARLIQAVLPIMMANRRGKIINFSGGGATAPRPNFSAYAAAKAALVRLTETLALELKPFNIQINAVAPGAINTNMLTEVIAAGDKAGSEYLQAIERAKTGGTPVNIVCELIRFMLSPNCEGLTGKLISAPHDPWRDWGGKADWLNSKPFYTIRRLDHFTIKPLIEDLG